MTVTAPLTHPHPTPRELDVIRLCAGGLVDREIAVRLGVSLRTVRFHFDNAKRRTKARTRCHLVALVVTATHAKE